ncbi:MAG: SdrD B-like domain-containing protein [Planctomycetota bacterium]
MLRRKAGPQRLEPRQLLAADPIHVGVVYLETDYLETDNDVGSDSRGDRFLLSFTGGAPDTELTQLRINTDKDGDGITVGDPIFDTEQGGRGKRGAHPFQLLRIQTSDGRQATAQATVLDGGQELILDLQNFRAGDRLEFTIDVDEVLRNSLDLALFNDRLDVITSGQEFQDSILEDGFEAPHFETATADSIFLNDYGSPNEDFGLNLPPDEGNDIDSRPNRSAAAVGSTQQQPSPISISGNVWIDSNLDERRGQNEDGLAGVDLALLVADENGAYQDTGHRAVTDDNGDYEFAESLGLLPGTYQVVETQPDGYFSVAAVPGTVDGQATGVAASVDVLSAIEIPLGGTQAINMDFAEAAPAFLGGFVYHDLNNNGFRKADEPGIGGVTIRLVPIDTLGDQPVRTTTTSEFGNYMFGDLAPGTYEVIEVTQPDGFVDGREQVGTIGNFVVGVADDPGDAIRGVRLRGGDIGIEYNFGELALGSLSGFVYLAAPGEDCTGDHDAIGNDPLGGVIVELQTPDGNVISQVTTTPMGEYRFDDVEPGEYRIVQWTPDGVLDGDSYAGQIDGVVVGNSIDGTLIRDITLAPGGTGVAYNFCEIAPATIAGYVYHDQSNDGVRDATEAAIPNAEVSLVNAEGNIVATTTTDETGRYEFLGIEPGTYELRQRQPDGFLDGIDTLGRVDNQELGVVENDRFREIALAQGVNGRDYNFGELLPASLSGGVHADIDGDCIRDDDELGIAGVLIRLLDASGNEVAQTRTNAEGIYRFTDLVPGTYSVVQEQPEGYFDGDARVGSEGGVSGENRISAVSLGSGVDAVDYDFCEEPPVSLSGAVFVDNDGDCVRHADERGIAGVVIELRDAAGNSVATTTTDEDGNYRFEGLRGGEYTIFEVQPEGYFQGGESLGSAGGAILGVDLMSVTLTPGENAVDYLFCEYEPSSISGSVWADNDSDQERDDDEPPLPGVVVKLVDENDVVIRTTTTDVDGAYRFDDLPPGIYSICQEQPGGYFHGGELVGTAGGFAVGEDLIVAIPLLGGVDAVRYDFPEVPPSIVSGFVFVDGDRLETASPIDRAEIRNFRDGRLTSDDRRLADVTIEIRDVFGQPLADDAFLDGDAETNSVVQTDASGHYRFEGLRPGTYTLFQTQPDTWIDSLDTPGTTGGLAINAGDLYTADQQDLIALVTGNSTSDAILDVRVWPGGESEGNNFSEIEWRQVTPPLPPPPVPPTPPPPPTDFLPIPDREPTFLNLAVPQEFPRVERVFLPPETRAELPQPIVGDVDFVTWHLSVINGGFPRGVVRPGGVFREAAVKHVEDHWRKGEQSEGRWRLMTLEGEVREESDQMNLGSEEAVALVGDFDGDGKDEVAVYVAGEWFVDLNGNGVWDAGDLWILLGTEMDRPVVGDWDGDGKDDVGIYGRRWERDEQRIRVDAGLPTLSNQNRNFVESRKQLGLVAAKLRGQSGERVLRRGENGDLRADVVDHVFQFGDDVDTPVSGDWNGDGVNQIGVFRSGQWVIDVEGDGRRKKAETTFEFGQPGDQPIVGDFNGDGVDEVGVVRGNWWIIDTDGDRRLTAADQQIRMDAPKDAQPIVGDFDGDGKDEPGYYYR